MIVKYKARYGTGTVKDGSIKVKELVNVTPRTLPDPGWDVAIDRNRYHLKNLERNAIRTIKHHMNDRPTVNVSFSGGKDSTAVLHLARKAGVTRAFFIDTGLEFPETIAFVKSQGVEIAGKAGDFWQAVEKAGPPGKDNRWCCKFQKLRPLKLYLAEVGPCVTIQGNRWYESWNRASLEETSQNPDNPLQLNVSPIRNWRALEVFLYLWWQKADNEPALRAGDRAHRLLPLPGDARERVPADPHEPPGVCTAVGRLRGIMGGKEGAAGSLLPLGPLAVEGDPPEDAGALPGAWHCGQRGSHGTGRSKIHTECEEREHG